jgi:hypothetical protein
LSVVVAVSAGAGVNIIGPYSEITAITTITSAGIIITTAAAAAAMTRMMRAAMSNIKNVA